MAEVRPNTEARSARFPRVLLMTDYPPDEQHGGGELVRRLIHALPWGSVCWFSSRPLRAGNMPDGFEHVPFACADFTLRRPNRLGLSSWREYLNLRCLSLLQARKAAAWAVQQNVEAVWIVLQEQTILSGPATARRLGLPYHASTHDAPYYLLAGRLGPMKMRWFEDHFYSVYRKAASRDVISEPMRRHLLTFSGADAMVVAPGVEDLERVLSEPVPPPRNAPLRIHHAGMIYDAGLLQNFILGLEKRRAAGAFPEFEFVLSGSEAYKPRMEPWPASAKWLGWLPEAELREALRRADLLYLQHPFDEHRRLFARTSFPSKMAAYLGARRPILFHAPEYSTIMEFARKHQLPLLLDDADGEKAAAELGEAIAKLGAGDWAAGYASAAREFDWAVTSRGFAEALECLTRK